MIQTLASSRFADSVERMQALVREGQWLAAWETGREHGPLTSWPGREGRTLAGRLAYELGAPRLSAVLHHTTFRAHRDDPEAQFFHVFFLRVRRGALVAWQARKRLGAPPADAPDAIADYHGQCAHLLGSLRDFEAAERHLERAASRAAERPYWYVERADLFGLEDRHDDALAAAREGLANHPAYGPVVLTAAHRLAVLGRDDEALELLRSAASGTQSSSIVGMLVQFLMRRRLFDEAGAALDRLEALTPLRDVQVESGILSMRAETAARRGDYALARELISRVDHPFLARIAENLRAFLDDPRRPAARRVELDVPFVAQHHSTCVPATLTAISRFWGKPAEHLEVAEEICYDGTPDYSERNWANTHGWVTKEFRVDWESAIGLLDRGIPFTLGLADVNTGHQCAVIGYDSPTGVFLSRDPGGSGVHEISARDLVEHRPCLGPRGMAMVPEERAEPLEGIALPEAELYDLYHKVQMALQSHDRATALEWRRRLVETAPGHRLTLLADRAVAYYDGNPRQTLVATRALLDLFPDDPRLQLDLLACMRETATRDERLAWLDTIGARSRENPFMWLEHAAELAADDRRRDEALWQVRRALRARPDDPLVIAALAFLTWQAGRFDEAIELRRFAACLAPAHDEWALQYVRFKTWRDETDAGIAFLRERFDRAGGVAAGPATSLFVALEQLDRVEEGFRVLDEAIARRPDDGTLRLFAANRFAKYGRADAAAVHLERARGNVKHTAWLAEAALAARTRGDRDEALRDWRAILEVEPLNIQAVRMVAVLLSESGAADAAIAHLRAACDAFPHHLALHQLLLEWTVHEPVPVREAIVRKMLATDPADAWAMRELATTLSQQSRDPDALEAIDEAIGLEGLHPAGHAIRGAILARIGRRAEAAASYRTAIAMFANNPAAIGALLEACDSLDERRDALAFVEAQITAQPMAGDGVRAYREAARGVLPPEEILVVLRRVHAARGDTWQTWSALSSHVLEMGMTDEASSIAEGAVSRWPHLSELRISLAETVRIRGDRSRASEIVREVVRADPSCGRGWDTLSTWFEAGAEGDRTIALARSLAEARPTDVDGWMRLARFELHVPRPEAALAAAGRAVSADPQHVPGHDLRALALAQLGRFDEAKRACEPPALRGRVDDTLDARSAWVDAQRGLIDDAVGRARKLVARSPDCVRGWMFLTEWEAQRGQLEKGATAAARWSSIEPGNAIPLGWLGDLRARLDDREGAKAAFRRAIHLEPGYLFAGLRYFGMQMEDGDFAGAAGTLQMMGARVPAFELVAPRVELAVAQSDLERAMTLIRDACLDATLDTRSIVGPLHAMRNDAWLPQIEHMLAELMDGGDSHPAAPMLWASVRARQGRLGTRRRYRQMAARGAPGKRAISALLHAIAEQARGKTRFAPTGLRLDAHIALIRRASADWWRDDQLWGEMGMALLFRGRSRAVAEWLADWRARPGAPLWVFNNLAIALLGLGRDAEGLAVLRHLTGQYLEKGVDREGHTALWAAIGACLDGDLASAQQLLDRMPEHTLEGDQRPIGVFARTLLEVLRADPADGLTEPQRTNLGIIDRLGGRDPAASRLAKLARWTVGRRVKDRWMMLRAWGSLHPTASAVTAMVVVLLVLNVVGSLAG